MKIRKIGVEESKINRDVISRVGETLYHDPHVEEVIIKVGFKDGSAISFRREEDEDYFETRFRRDCEDN